MTDQYYGSPKPEVQWAKAWDDNDLVEAQRIETEAELAENPVVFQRERNAAVMDYAIAQGVETHVITMIRIQNGYYAQAAATVNLKEKARIHAMLEDFEKSNPLLLESANEVRRKFYGFES